MAESNIDEVLEMAESSAVGAAAAALKALLCFYTILSPFVINNTTIALTVQQYFTPTNTHTHHTRLPSFGGL